MAERLRQSNISSNGFTYSSRESMTELHDGPYRSNTSVYRDANGNVFRSTFSGINHGILAGHISIGNMPAVNRTTTNTTSIFGTSNKGIQISGTSVYSTGGDSIRGTTVLGANNTGIQASTMEINGGTLNFDPGGMTWTPDP